MNEETLMYKTRAEIYGLLAVAMLIFAVLSSCQKSRLSNEVESLKEDLSQAIYSSNGTVSDSASHHDDDYDYAYNEGYNDGFKAGQDDGYKYGYEDGYNAGYDEALNEK